MTAMNFPPISRQRVSTQVSEHLERMILAGEIPEGSRLPSEKELGLRFGISRNAVREAIKSLEERGLVRVRNGRGAYVTAPGDGVVRAAIARYVQSRLTPETVPEFYQFREVLEGAAARIAAARAGERDLHLLERALGMMEANEGDVEKWMEGDIAFHRALIGATHNPFLMTVLEPVIDCLREAIKVSFDGEGARAGLICHAAILDGIRAHDPARAQSAMLATLDDSRERVRQALASGQQSAVSDQLLPEGRDAGEHQHVGNRPEAEG
jgi:GntR family transcriptional repressor for pyruvate dehydrogenase complex